MEKEPKIKKGKMELNVFLIKYFRLLVLGICLLLLAGAFFFLIRPKYAELNQLSAETAKLQADYGEQQAYFSKLKELEGAYNQIDPRDIEKIAAILPSSDDQEDLLPQVESMAARSGLLLTSLSVTKKDEDKTAGPGSSGPAAASNLPAGVKSLKISMELAGIDYVGLKNMLAALENNLRLINVDRIVFSPEENKATIEASAYYLK